MDAIKTVDLTKKFKSFVSVDKINLSIPKGEIFALLGVNGAGKTTTIRMLSCLLKPTSGTAYVEGNCIITAPEKVKSCIGVSPQETAVAPNLTVKENLELICGIYKTPKEKSRLKIRELTEMFCLHEILNKKAGVLSGGWQRRISIAMALVCEPRVLFLDEPTLGLDVLARSELWGLIRSLKGKVTIVLTTHYMEEAEALSDRIGIMNCGKLLVTGTVKELIEMTQTDNLSNAFIRLIEEART